MKIILAAMAAAVSVISASAAQATTVYDNGAPTNSTGNFVDGFTVADDFTLGSAARLTRASVFLAIIPQDDVPVTQLFYGIYFDSGSGPGALLATGAAVDPVFTKTDLTFEQQAVWKVSFDFAQAFDAHAGQTYWFGLSAPRPFPSIVWMAAEANGTQGSWHTDFDNPDRGFLQDPHPLEHAFSLEAGVPEPAAWTLMIAGFGLAGTSLRRRRAVAA